MPRFHPLNRILFRETPLPAILLAAVLLGSPALAQTANLAFGATASQSSTSASLDASRAVDGHYDGYYENGWLTSTLNQPSPWWEVDLGSIHDLDEIRIWNRRDDCCRERLADFYVLVSDVPFGSTDLATVLAQPGVSADFFPGQIDAPRGILERVSVNRTGRYIRIQLQGSNTLQLAEVEVFPEGATPAPPQTFVVDTTSDEADTNPGDLVCMTAGGACSLRAALEEASLDGGSTSVEFDIAGAGPHVIVLNSELPPLYDAFGGTSINGFSQPGSSPNTLFLGSDTIVQIEIQAASGSERGIEILSAGNALSGLSMWNFNYYALRIHGQEATDNLIKGNWFGLSADGSQSGVSGPGVSIKDGGASNRIGGPDAADRNVIVRSFRAIDLRGSRSVDNVIENNYIGVMPDGLSRAGNWIHAIDINTGAPGTIVRSNVIASSSGNGIEISHTDANRDHLIENNIIGADPFLQTTSRSWGNGNFGIHLEDRVHDIVIRGNVIAFSRLGGIRTFSDVSNILIQDNWIGLLPSGSPAANGSFGVALRNGSFNVQVGPGNVIAHNWGPGVSVQGGDNGGVTTDQATITRNSMFDNDDLGIVLTSGASNPLPTIEFAHPVGVEGNACAGCTVELFVAQPDPTGAGEGATFVDSTVAGPDGRWTFSPPPGALEPGDEVTATATENDDTSEFADNVIVVIGEPTAQFEWNCQAVRCSFDGSSSVDDVEVVSWSWDFDGDAREDASGATPSHDFPLSGTYPVTLVVTDGDGLTDSLERLVTVTTTPPIGMIEWSCFGWLCSFDGSTSTDDQGVVSWQWDLDDDGVFEESGAIVEILFSETGLHRVSLRVEDPEGLTHAVSEDVTLGAGTPHEVFTTYQCVGLSCDLSAIVRGVPESEIAQWFWDFDGDQEPDAEGPRVNHTLSGAGMHTVQLTVVENDGDDATQVLTIDPAESSSIFGLPFFP
jgi:CSLREA domain-containing protein